MKNRGKYLLDECITIHWPFNVGKLDDYIRSVDVIGHGAKDEEVYDLAIKQNRILVTSDKKFTLYAILESQSVIFQKMNGERYFIKPMVKQLENVGKRDDYITQYLLDKEEIIVP